MKKQLSLLLLLTIFTVDIFACTSAIFTGKITADGRPLMWKHRDTGQENNKIEYVTGEKYKFLALYNSPDNLKEAWTGTNEVGFSIMNTASYNLKYDDVPSNQMDREGEVMYNKLNTVVNRYLKLPISYLGAIPYDHRLEEAVMQQQPVSMKNPNSRSALAYENMAYKLMDKEYDRSLVKRGMAAFFSHIVAGNKKMG